MLSDTVPIMGFHKSGYIFIAAVLGTIAVTGLAVLPMASAAVAAVFFAAVNVEAQIINKKKYSAQRLFPTSSKYEGTDTDF